MTAKVLLVEDDRALREALADTLMIGGHEFRAVECAEDAVAALGEEAFSLVISDVNMPNMDGISFVKAAKQLPAYKFTPVIMLTTEAGDAKKAEGQAAGAKAWVVKPFQPAQMLAAVTKLILP